jgi:hypothetical protein
MSRTYDVKAYLSNILGPESERRRYVHTPAAAAAAAAADPTPKYKLVSEGPFSVGHKTFEVGEEYEIVEILGNLSNLLHTQIGSFSSGPFVKAKLKSLDEPTESKYGNTLRATVTVKGEEKKQTDIPGTKTSSFFFVKDERDFTREEIDALVKIEQKEQAALRFEKNRAHAEERHERPNSRSPSPTPPTPTPLGGRKSRRSKSNKNKRTRRKSAKRQYRRRK